MKQWKIDTEPFYGKLFNLNGFNFIEKAGFFFDDYDKPIDLVESLKILCTPIKHILEPKTNKHCILVSSGAMDPTHSGHITMMSAAKKRAEREGYEVLGGYICPSHDSYTSIKNTNSYPIHVRNRYTNELIIGLGQKDWIAVDPWSGTFTKCDVNFTTIIQRLKLFINKYKNLETEIIYVCGEDRANFSETFKLDGKCIVVGRPGHKSNFRENSYALFAEGFNSRASSIIERSIKLKKRDLSLRDDKTIDLSLIKPIFEKYFGTITINDFDNQQKIFDTLDLDKIISIDSLLKGKYNITMSRMYDFFGCSQFGFFVKTMQLPKDTSIDYTIVDDDCVSGRTVDFVLNLLYNFKITVKEKIVFTSSRNGDFEILDLRDFNLFTENSGLTVDDDLRVPYIYPFVDPYTRCSVIDPLNFSIDIWSLNKKISKNISIKNSSHYKLYSLLGFSDEVTTHEICDYYIDVLKATILKND